MKVILLAAGRSRRVKPIEDKNFLKFCGKTLIHHQCDALRTAGFEEFVLMAGAHNRTKLQAFAEEFMQESGGKVTVQVIEQEDLGQGMAGAVSSAHKALEGEGKGDDPVMIVSSNDVVDAEAYRLVLDAAQNESYDAILLGKRVTEYFPGGYLKIDKDWRVHGIVEKPGAGNEPSDLVNLVVHFHRNLAVLAEAVRAVNSERDDRYEQALDQMIQKDSWVQAVAYEGSWNAIKVPWHVRDVAQHYFERAPKQVSPKAVIEEGARVSGEVIFEEGVKVMTGATVVGPVYLGKNTLVATNALVRDAQVGDRCVIGFGTEVARSVLGDDVWTHTNYLGDSLIGNNVSFGAGSVTGNLRFDEGPIAVEIDGERVNSGRNKLGLIAGNEIRVGINTSFMPGIKIGSGSLIGPGLVVDRNIPENSFVKGTVTLNIRPNTGEALPSRDSFHKSLKA